MAKGSLDSMSSSYLPDHPGLASNDSNARIQASNSLRDLSSVKTATEPIPITPNQSLHGSRRPSLAKDLSPLTSAASDGVQSSSGEGLNLTGSSTETSSTIHSKNGPSTTASRITRSISKQNIFRSVNLRKKTSSEGVIADPILINTGPRRSTSALFNKSVTISNEDPYQHQHLQLQRHSVSNLLDVEGDNNNKNIINKNNIIFQVNPSTTKIIQSDSFDDLSKSHSDNESQNYAQTHIPAPQLTSLTNFPNSSGSMLLTHNNLVLDQQTQILKSEEGLSSSPSFTTTNSQNTFSNLSYNNITKSSSGGSIFSTSTNNFSSVSLPASLNITPTPIPPSFSQSIAPETDLSSTSKKNKNSLWTRSNAASTTKRLLKLQIKSKSNSKSQRHSNVSTNNDSLEQEKQPFPPSFSSERKKSTSSLLSFNSSSLPSFSKVTVDDVESQPSLNQGNSQHQRYQSQFTLSSSPHHNMRHSHSAQSISISTLSANRTKLYDDSLSSSQYFGEIKHRRSEDITNQHSFDFLLEEDDEEKISTWHHHEAEILSYMDSYPGFLRQKKIWYLSSRPTPDGKSFSNLNKNDKPYWKCALGSIDTKSHLSLVVDNNTETGGVLLSSHDIRSAKVKINIITQVIQIKLEPSNNYDNIQPHPYSSIAGDDSDKSATFQQYTNEEGNIIPVITLKCSDSNSGSCFHEWVAAILLHANLKPPGLENKVYSPFQVLQPSIVPSVTCSETGSEPLPKNILDTQSEVVFEGYMQIYIPYNHQKHNCQINANQTKPHIGQANIEKSSGSGDGSGGDDEFVYAEIQHNDTHAWKDKDNTSRSQPLFSRNSHEQSTTSQHKGKLSFSDSTESNQTHPDLLLDSPHCDDLIPPSSESSFNEPGVSDGSSLKSVASSVSPFNTCEWTQVYATLYKDGMLKFAYSGGSQDIDSDEINSVKSGSKIYHTINVGHVFSSGIRLLDRSVFDVPNVIYLGDRPIDDANLDSLLCKSISSKPIFASNSLSINQGSLHQDNSAPATLRPTVNDVAIRAPVGADGLKPSKILSRMSSHNNIPESPSVTRKESFESSASRARSLHTRPVSSIISTNSSSSSASVSKSGSGTSADPPQPCSLSSSPISGVSTNSSATSSPSGSVKKRRSLHLKYKKSSTSNPLPHTKSFPLTNQKRSASATGSVSMPSSAPPTTYSDANSNNSSATLSASTPFNHDLKNYSSVGLFTVSHNSISSGSDQSTEFCANEDPKSSPYMESDPFRLSTQPENDTAIFLHFGTDSESLKKWFSALKSIARLEIFSPSTGNLNESFRISRTITVRVLEVRLEPIEGLGFSRCSSTASLQTINRNPLPNTASPISSVSISSSANIPPLSSNSTPPVTQRTSANATPSNISGNTIRKVPTLSSSASLSSFPSPGLSSTRDSQYAVSNTAKGQSSPASSFHQKPTQRQSQQKEPNPFQIQSMSTLPDSYVEIYFGGRAWARTSIAKSSRMPFWREDYAFKDFPGIGVPKFYFVLRQRQSSKTETDENENFLDHQNDPVLGYVALTPSDIRKNGNLEKPYEITSVYPNSSSPQYRASLFLKIAYEELTIGPAQCYMLIDKTLSSLANRNWARLIQSDERRDVTLLSETCLEICLSEASGFSAIKWIKSLITEEIYKTHRFMIEKSGDAEMFSSSPRNESKFADLKKNIDNTLFRGNSILTKSLERYMRIVGYNLLVKTVGTFVKLVISEQPDLEMDPSRIKIFSKSTGTYSTDLDKDDPEVVAASEVHQTKLAHYTSLLWKLIRDSADEIPPGFKELFSHLSKELRSVLNQTETSVYNSVAGFLFLRFFCPAILNPKLFGLVRTQSVMTVQRSLTLITKMIQCFANRTRFGIKEPWMIPMNSFFEEHKDELFEYFGKVLTVDPNISTEAALEKTTDGKFFKYTPHPLGQNFNNPFLIDRTSTFMRLIELWKSSYCTADQLSKLTYERDSRKSSIVNSTPSSASSMASLSLVPQTSQTSTRNNSITTIMSSYVNGLPVHPYSIQMLQPSIDGQPSEGDQNTVDSSKLSPFSFYANGSVSQMLYSPEAEKWYHDEVTRLFGDDSVPVESLIEDFSKLCNYIDDVVRRLRVKLEIQHETFSEQNCMLYSQHLQLKYSPKDNQVQLLNCVGVLDPHQEASFPKPHIARSEPTQQTKMVSSTSTSSSEVSVPVSTDSEKSCMTANTTASASPSPTVPRSITPTVLVADRKPLSPTTSSPATTIPSVTISPPSSRERIREHDMVPFAVALAASRSDFEAYYNYKNNSSLQKMPSESTSTLRKSTSNQENLPLASIDLDMTPFPSADFVKTQIEDTCKLSTQLDDDISTTTVANSIRKADEKSSIKNLSNTSRNSSPSKKHIPSKSLESPNSSSKIRVSRRSSSLSFSSFPLISFQSSKRLSKHSEPSNSSSMFPSPLPPPSSSTRPYPRSTSMVQLPSSIGPATAAAAAAITHSSNNNELNAGSSSFSKTRFGSTNSPNVPGALPLPNSPSSGSYYYTPTSSNSAGTSPITAPSSNQFSPSGNGPRVSVGSNAHLRHTGGSKQKRNSAGTIVFSLKSSQSSQSSKAAPHLVSHNSQPNPSSSPSGTSLSAPSSKSLTSKSIGDSQTRSRSLTYPRPRPMSQIITSTSGGISPSRQLSDSSTLSSSSDSSNDSFLSTHYFRRQTGNHLKHNSISAGMSHGSTRPIYSSNSSHVSGITPRSLAERSGSMGSNPPSSPVLHATKPHIYSSNPASPVSSSTTGPSSNTSASAAAAAAVARSTATTNF
ncbi:uncharacterized protein SAPINGB_P001080 [Magnusiomyces paraingens]|uniref:Uncharacterized protein n=1 Tax=Magnusiomyces paraingens TaxID=2606893 RepID=A0A5E8B3W4_9ASCO|nr:uncharacterized protein SAPINGB_P001080 [Saprochaete ingens]VVT46169.1 unnamed protein product [Saprochaete ingens]